MFQLYNNVTMNNLFIVFATDEAFLSISLTSRGQLVKCLYLRSSTEMGPKVRLESQAYTLDV